MIKVFISHSSKDAVLAKQLIDLIRSALNLPSSDIRCTSVPGYKLPGGAETDRQLRSELLDATVFIGLITEAGLASAYVLFELGARWGADKQLIPLMAPGVSPEILQGPISNINALSCSSTADLQQLTYQIAEVLDIEVEQSAVYQDDVELITAYPAAIPTAPTSVYAPSVPQTAVDQLAELRSEAIHDILNRLISTDAELRALSAFTKDWWQRVKDVLEQDFSKAEQLNFTRLGAVPHVIFPHSYNDVHAKILREFALQERRMLDIIARHTHKIITPGSPTRPGPTRTCLAGTRRTSRPTSCGN